MFIQKNSELPAIQGREGTTIKQYFHPQNTQNKIRFSLAELTIESGKKSFRHKLKSSEIYYILEGEGILHINEKSSRVTKGDSAFVPPLSEQFLENTGQRDLKFLCIVEPAWKSEDEIILE